MPFDWVLGLANPGGYNALAPLDSNELTQLFKRAYDLGIRCYDGAPHYMGDKAARQSWEKLGIKTDTLNIYHKVGRSIIVDVDKPKSSSAEAWFRMPPFNKLTVIWDLSYHGVLQQAATTMQVLDIEHFEGLSLHDPRDAETQLGSSFNFETHFTHGAVKALVALKVQGITSKIGIGTKDIPMALRLVKAFPKTWDYIMITNYNLMTQSEVLSEFLPLCESEGIEVVLASILASGILACDDPLSSPGVTCNYLSATIEERQKAVKMLAIAKSVGLPDLKAASFAIAIELAKRNSIVKRIVTGGRNSLEIEQNIKPDAQVPKRFWTLLKEQGLVDPRAPLPLD